MTVCLDPGHGGTDNGAEDSGVMEKRINAQVTRQIESHCIASHVDYVTTRHFDTAMALSNRVDYSTKMDADIFVSIHSNWFKDSAVGGYEVHHYPESHDGRELAKSIHGCMSKQDYIAPRPIKKSDFYVLRETEIPAVLIEMGFLSNRDNRKILTNLIKTNVMAQQIVEAISWFDGGSQ